MSTHIFLYFPRRAASSLASLFLGCPYNVVRALWYEMMCMFIDLTITTTNQQGNYYVMRGLSIYLLWDSVCARRRNNAKHESLLDFILGWPSFSLSLILKSLLRKSRWLWLYHMCIFDISFYNAYSKYVLNSATSEAEKKWSDIISSHHIFHGCCWWCDVILVYAVVLLCGDCVARITHVKCIIPIIIIIFARRKLRVKGRTNKKKVIQAHTHIYTRTFISLVSHMDYDTFLLGNSCRQKNGTIMIFLCLFSFQSHYFA